MNVKINDDYFIEADGRNFILRYRQKRNARSEATAKNEYFGYLYFGHLEHLFKEVLSRTLMLSEDNFDSVEDMKNLIKTTEESIVDAINSSEMIQFMKKRAEESTPVTEKSEAEVAFVPVKRKRGRPRKNQLPGR